jgi:hypothetical protein
MMLKRSRISKTWFGQRTALDCAALAVSFLILVYAVYSCARLALQHDVRYMLMRIGDDASYYMTTARNIAEGRGMTFDGIHPTNGFHPLWLLLLVPLFLLHDTPETMIRLVALTQTALLSLAYLAFLRTQAKLFSLPTAALSGTVFIYFVFLPCVNGMESALLVLLIVVLYGYALHIAQSQLNRQRAVSFGIILGLVLLARLDMIFIPLAMLGCFRRRVLNRETRSAAIAIILIGGIATGAVVAPYLVFNYLKFGAIMPISGTLKSSFPHLALNRNAFDRIAAIGPTYLASAGLAIGWSLWRIIRIASRRPALNGKFYTTSTTVFAWAVTLHFLYVVLYMKWGVFSWYFATYPLFAIVLISGLIERIVESTVMPGRPALYGVTAAALCSVVIVRDQTRDPFPQNGGWHTPVYNAAVWAREHTPEEAIFAMSDCGHFAFFSTRRVINLDGLANNMDFQRALAQQHLSRYLSENHVDFMVQHAVHSRGDVISGGYDSLMLRFESRRFDGLGDTVLVRKQLEVYRSSLFFDGPYPSVLLIWSLRGG